MTNGSRHAAPIRVLADQSIAQLVQLQLGQSLADGGKREKFIQNLVHDHPETLPMVDIEPAFSPLISVCQELQTPAGYVDNVWLTPAGGLVLGECKLVRNPEARREVVAQSLDYARAIGAWTYADLEQGVRKARKISNEPDCSLWSLVEDDTDLDEAQFVDAVERRLRTGRLLILIIGDGIQEGVEALTEHLQMHAGIHAGMALVDLSIWSDPAGGLLVVPRVPMRTVLIERGIVTFDPGVGVRVEPPKGAVTGAIPKQRPVTASEPEFYAQLEQTRPDHPGLAGELQAFLASLSELGVEPVFRRSVVLRFRPSPDYDASAGYVDKTGAFHHVDAWIGADRLGRTAAGDAYLQALADAVGGTVRKKDGSAWPTVVGPDGRVPDVAVLLKKAGLWRQAIGALVAALTDDKA